MSTHTGSSEPSGDGFYNPEWPASTETPGFPLPYQQPQQGTFSHPPQYSQKLPSENRRRDSVTGSSSDEAQEYSSKKSGGGTRASRPRLNYHRNTIACSHCRHRKIRCVISSETGKCENCVRQNKECKFLPVGSAEPVSRVSVKGKRQVSQSTSPDTRASPAAHAGAQQEYASKQSPAPPQSRGQEEVFQILRSTYNDPTRAQQEKNTRQPQAMRPNRSAPYPRQEAVYDPSNNSLNTLSLANLPGGVYQDPAIQFHRMQLPIRDSYPRVGQQYHATSGPYAENFMFSNQAQLPAYPTSNATRHDPYYLSSSYSAGNSNAYGMRRMSHTEDQMSAPWSASQGPHGRESQGPGHASVYPGSTYPRDGSNGPPTFSTPGPQGGRYAQRPPQSYPGGYPSQFVPQQHIHTLPHMEQHTSPKPEFSHAYIQDDYPRPDTNPHR